MARIGFMDWDFMSTSKLKRTRIQFLLLNALLLAMPAFAQYSLAPALVFVTNNGAITITRYTTSIVTGPGTGVLIPDSTNGYPVTGISSNAFWECSPTSVIIPDSITNIGEGAFGYCSYLTNIVVGAGNPNYTSLNGLLFNKSKTLLLQFPAGLTSHSYSIPGSVTRIGAAAFAGCASLAWVTIPGSVRSIGASAFFECFSLTNMTIPDSVIHIESDAFFHSGLRSVTIPNSITNIGGDAFADCSGLTNVVMGTNVTDIGKGAFYNSYSLTSVTLPNSLTNISAWAFWNCSLLTNIYFLGDAPQVDSSAFSGDQFAEAFYLPDTTGWNQFNLISGVPIFPWLPKLQSAGASFGVQTNQFGFNLNWASGQTVVVEACTNLFNPDWQPVQTNVLVNGSAHFRDPQWTNYPRRFYRLRSL